MGPEHRTLTRTAGGVVGAVALAVLGAPVGPELAGATLPGRNGRIATTWAEPNTDETFIATVNPNRPSRPRSLPIPNFINDLAYSPRGDFLAFEGSGQRHAISVAATRPRFALPSGRTAPLTRPSACDLDGSPAWSRSGHSVAFERRFGAFCHPRRSTVKAAIFAVDPGTRQVRQVGARFRVGQTSEGGELDWSSRGEIVFGASSGTGASETRELFVMTATGTRLRRLTTKHLDSSANWSPDGSRVAFLRDIGGRSCRLIYTVGRKGGRPTRFQLRPPDAACPVSVAWSPEGDELAINSGDGIAIADARSGRVRSVDDDPVVVGDDLLAFDWQPLSP